MHRKGILSARRTTDAFDQTMNLAALSERLEDEVRRAERAHSAAWARPAASKARPGATS